MNILFKNAFVKTDALGSNLHKIRVARPGGGKSGGFRNVVFLKNEKWVIAIHIFAKADKGNLSTEELEYFRALANEYNKFTEKGIDKLLSKNILLEYHHEN